MLFCERTRDLTAHASVSIAHVHAHVTCACACTCAWRSERHVHVHERHMSVMMCLHSDLVQIQRWLYSAQSWAGGQAEDSEPAPPSSQAPFVPRHSFNGGRSKR
eukprot:3899872-Prymnesium_polylepis.1